MHIYDITTDKRTGWWAKRIATEEHERLEQCNVGAASRLSWIQVCKRAGDGRLEARRAANGLHFVGHQIVHIVEM